MIERSFNGKSFLKLQNQITMPQTTETLRSLILILVQSGTKHEVMQFEPGNEPTTRGELEGHLVSHNIPYANMDMVIAPGELGLISPDSVIQYPQPTVKAYKGEQVSASTIGVFLTPRKNSSGAPVEIDIQNANAQWIRAEVKRLYNSNEEAKAFFREGLGPSQNWSNHSTDELRKRLTTWMGKEDSGKVKVKPQKQTAEPKKVKVEAKAGEKKGPVEYKTEMDVLKAYYDTVEEFIPFLGVFKDALSELTKAKVKPSCNTNSFAAIPEFEDRIGEMYSMFGNILHSTRKDMNECETALQKEEEKKEEKKAAANSVESVFSDLESLFNKKYNKRR